MARPWLQSVLALRMVEVEALAEAERAVERVVGVGVAVGAGAVEKVEVEGAAAEQAAAMTV